MHQLDQKKLLIETILPYLTGAPADAVQRLLQKSVSDLEQILDDAITKRARAEAAERVKQHADEMRRESQLEGSFVHACMAVINNRRLSTCDGNRAMLESLLNPGEEPSAKLYAALAEQYPTKFAWETPQSKPTKEDQRATFDAFVRENNLSSVEANFNLFKEGASVEHFAGASGIERAQYANEQAQARQHFLIHDATPQQLKEEAQFQSATEREIAIKAEADRQHQFVSQAQAGLYSPLPTHNQAGELMDGKYFKRISTLDYQLFKAMVRKHGSAQITERLRSATPAPAVPAV
jgi:hypothetical protein